MGNYYLRMTGLLYEQYKWLDCKRPQNCRIFYFPIKMHANKPPENNINVSSTNPRNVVAVVIVFIVWTTLFCKVYTLQPQCWWFANVGTNHSICCWTLWVNSKFNVIIWTDEVLCWQYCWVVKKVNTSFIGARVMCFDRKIIDIIAKMFNRNNRLPEVLIFVFIRQWNYLQYFTVSIIELLLWFLLIAG